MMGTGSMCSVLSHRHEIRSTGSSVVWHSQGRASFLSTEHLSQHLWHSFVRNNGSSYRIHFNHKSVPSVHSQVPTFVLN